MGILVQPVMAHTPEHSRENVAGQTRHLDPRQDEKARIIGHIVQITRAHLRAPANVVSGPSWNDILTANAHLEQNL
jgi:hypothetical protein